MSISIRTATTSDIPLILDFIQRLADYERLRDKCVATEEALARHLFGERPVAEALIGEIDGVPHGFAIFFTTFSTFAAKPCIYLEDLFVNPESRGVGLGKALLLHLVSLAEERGCARVEWSVLDWNEPSIEFYKKLGAKPMDEWTVFRLTLPV